MAIQKSSIKLEGSIGDLTFYKQNNTYQVKQRSGHSAKRIANDPKFARTRENSSEFGHASHIAKCIRFALRNALGQGHSLFYESSLINRLTQRISCIVKSDEKSERGLRRVQAANLQMLTHFSMNSKAPLKDTFFIPVEVDYDNAQEISCVKIDCFFPQTSLLLPKKASSFKFHLIIISLDIKNETSSSVTLETPFLPIENRINKQTLSLAVPRSATVKLICFGVSFYRQNAGYTVPIDEPNQNALDIIQISNSMH